MIQICKSKNQFYVVTMAKNGRVDSITEGFTTKAKAWKNILSQAKMFHAHFQHSAIRVQDNTGQVPDVYSFYIISGKKYWLKDEKAQKPHKMRGKLPKLN